MPLIRENQAMSFFDADLDRLCSRSGHGQIGSLLMAGARSDRVICALMDTKRRLPSNGQHRADDRPPFRGLVQTSEADRAIEGSGEVLSARKDSLNEGSISRRFICKQFSYVSPRQRASRWLLRLNYTQKRCKPTIEQSCIALAHGSVQYAQ
jgi:hypothetical protein